MTSDQRSGEHDLSISLISHTNVGKTTLARTLLKKDIGEVLDQAHVTDEASAFAFIATPDGKRALLWDTPGFGDSARLLKRLRAEHNPLQWIKSQLWDRFRDRPLWCTQQAVHNVREVADVVLYLANASEDPSMASYVTLEMQVLEWIGKPVIVLLNQTGMPISVAARLASEKSWKDHLSGHGVVRAVTSLDAFTRCWVQEGLLLKLVQVHLPEARQDLASEILSVWINEQRQLLTQSIDILASMLARAALDSEPISSGGIARLVRRRALTALGERFSNAVRRATDEVIALNGLAGASHAELSSTLEDVRAPGERPDPWRAGALGGAAGGALGGLAADLASGGLSFGGGAVAGAILGALGLGGAAWGSQQLGGEEEPRLVWSAEFIERQLRDALLRYLSIAHFGRGGGEFRERAHPDFWREAVAEALAPGSVRLRKRLQDLQRSNEVSSEAVLKNELSQLLLEVIQRLLTTFYPGSEQFLAIPPPENAP